MGEVDGVRDVLRAEDRDDLLAVGSNRLDRVVRLRGRFVNAEPACGLLDHRPLSFGQFQPAFEDELADLDVALVDIARGTSFGTLVRRTRRHRAPFDTRADIPPRAARTSGRHFPRGRRMSARP